MAIGVAVSDSPTGPFKDALGKPLVSTGTWDNIDLRFLLMMTDKLICIGETAIILCETQ
jgi:hypothetical protein